MGTDVAPGVRGRVTDGKEGLAGVAVTDGRHVTRTDADGRFHLPGEGPFLSVTTPSGWTTPRWYLPADTADPSFVLARQEQPLPLSFVHVTDLHVSLGATDPAPDGSDATIFVGDDGSMRERVVTSPAVIADLWAELARRVPEAAFVAATGDLTNTGSDEEYRAWSRSIAASRIPVVSIPGNHDHHAQEGELPETAASVDFHAVPGRYESHLGPRWFSFEHSGLHIVAIDWFTHRLGIDADHQEAWLRADLEATATGMPVVLLSHDQMPSDFFDRLPRRPIATFSGHWHTSRVARVAGTLHVNTPTATFGGLDYSPASFRVARWDGTDLRVQTHHRAATHAVERRPSHTGCETLAVVLAGHGNRSTPVVAGSLVLVTTSDEDRPAGWLTAVDRVSGEIAWSIALDSAVKSAPSVQGSVAVATAVTGETVCVGLDGTERWRRHLDDPLRLWAYLRPALHDGRVHVGDVGRFCTLDLGTGELLWDRRDLGQRENLTSVADPVVVDGTLLVAMAGQTPVLQGLDPTTGATRWPQGTTGRSIYRLAPNEVMQELPRTVMAPPVIDGRDVIVVRLGSVVERLRANDGSTVWTAAHHGWFNPGRGAVVGDLAIFPIGTGSVRAVDRETGDLRWVVDVGGPAPLAAGAYRASGPLALGGLAACGDGVLVATGDGAVSRLDLDGRVRWRRELPAAVLGGVATDETWVWTTTVDGTLHRMPLAAH